MKLAFIKLTKKVPIKLIEGHSRSLFQKKARKWQITQQRKPYPIRQRESKQFTANSTKLIETFITRLREFLFKIGLSSDAFLLNFAGIRHCRISIRGKRC